MKSTLIGALVLWFGGYQAFGSSSVFTTRLDDPKAVYLSMGEAGARGDGTADDSVAIQAAIDRAGENSREGIVFIPSGRYRLSRTLYVWPGVRVIGFGATRPVFVLGDNTPGFQSGIGVMLMFTGFGPGQMARLGMRVPFPPQGSVPPNAQIADANPGTFYSAMSNIDFEIGKGNDAAVAVRFHVAQHSFLSHMDFHVGSGLAGLYQAGNEAEDLHFYGGRYGILTEKTSPAWQFTLIDSTFEGQREAALREHEAGLTLIRDAFHEVPIAIDIDAEYSDQLWVKDCRFVDISRQVVTISNEKSPLTEIGFDGAVVEGAPIFAKMRESEREIAGKGKTYEVKTFNFGLIVPGLGMMGSMGMHYDAKALDKMPEPMPPAIRALPPTSEWVNVHELNVKGDGATDDTAAIQAAIKEHRVLYFPSGHYVVKDTITLSHDTVLIGMHPSLTQFDLPDASAGYQGVGVAKAVISAPPGGTNIISGIGVFTGGINPRAVAVLWKAGEQSLIDDVRFLGGHGSGTNPYNNNHTADPDLHKRWDSQYPSLWITDGGGGTFADIWTPNTFAQSGFLVSNTRTPGHVYELSTEHHVRNEIKFDHVENWEVNAPQTEEEAGESPEALSIELDWSKNILIANYHGYRVTRSRAPFPAAVRLYQSENIRFRNVHVNAESGYATCDKNGCGTFLRVSKFPYDDAIEDATHHLAVREREFAVLDIPEKPSRPMPPAPGMLSPGTHVEKLEDGFFSISGATVDRTGKLYFVDHHQQRIYGWSRVEGLTIERDNPLDPVNLGLDDAGNLLVVSSAGPEGTVYSLHPGTPGDQITVLESQPLTPHPKATYLLPVNYWTNGEFKDQLDLNTYTYTTIPQMFAADVTARKGSEYAAPDDAVFLPASRVFQQGPADDASGWRFSDNLDTYGLLKARAGQMVFVSSESEDRTYSAVVQPDGSLGDLKRFTERGGECVAVDAKGNVYVANGQIFIYDPAGKQVGEIDVPERPIDIVFGGPGGDTLFILSHHALFAAHVEPR